MKKLITIYVHPPIPIRSHDWIAFRDGEEEGPRGYGETEWEAVKDLTEVEEMDLKKEWSECVDAYLERGSQAPEKVGVLTVAALIDGAYDIIEIWDAKTPAQKAWKAEWLRKAKQLGAQPNW